MPAVDGWVGDGVIYAVWVSMSGWSQIIWKWTISSGWGQRKIRNVNYQNDKSVYSRVSFCDGSFYTKSLLRPLSSWKEHSWLVVHHCHNSSISSLRSALLALFQCACVSFYFSAVLLSWLWFFHPWRPSKRQKRKNQNSWFYSLPWSLLNHGLGLLHQNRKWFDWFFQLSV
jgi:hypothetical protein